MKNNKEIATLHDLMVMQLKSLNDIEIQWSKAVDEMIEKISSRELKKLFGEDGEMAEKHSRKIEGILAKMDVDKLVKKNAVVRDLIREMEDLKDKAADPEVLDAGAIVIHQCLNHYKIAKYGSLASFARLMHRENIADALHEMMEDEKKEDIELSSLAEAKINEKAKTALLV